MTNSWKLWLCTGLCVTATIVGCGDDDDSSNTNGGSGNQAGSAGSSAGKAGSGNGGSSSGSANGGSAGKGGSGGSSNGGSAGGGGKAGASNGGTAPAIGGEGGAQGGVGGAEGGAGPVDCMEEAIGGAGPEGAGGAPAATTAYVLVDNITVKNGATVVKAWAFDDGADILDVVKGDVGDKWLRPPFDTGADNLAYSSPYAHDVFSKCDGKPAGSLLNVVPFEKAAQYYKLSIGFAPADWSGYTVTADVKLVSGGNQSGACDVNAKLYVQDGADNKSGTAVQLNVGDGWKSMTLTVPASTTVDHLSVNISDYTCN